MASSPGNRTAVRWVSGGRNLRASAFVRTGRILFAVLLIVSGRCESQEPGVESPASSDAEPRDCRSVVLLRCAQLPQEPTSAGAPIDSRQITQKKLDSHRLHQMQAEVGLNAVEITAERPQNPEPDPWESFSQSISAAEGPNCFAPEAPSRERFAAGGLLRLPFLARAAIVGKCQ
jgi:hypothetical protein